MKLSLLYLLICVLAILYLVFGDNGLLKYYSLINSRNTYIKQSKDMDNKIDKLGEELEFLKKDKDYLEKIIRKELNMKKKDEDLYIINKDDKEVYSNSTDEKYQSSN
jgi:cell division protein FtsB